MRFKLVERYITEDIEAVRKMYPEMDDMKFRLAISLDPTFDKNSNSVGTYGKWILNLYKRKGKIENIWHLTDLLKRFDEEKPHLKNKDINTFKSMEDVEAYLNDGDNYTDLSHRQKVRQNQKDRKNADIENDLMFSGDVYDIYVPSSYANSCKLGQGTSWCTASTETDSYYNSYKRDYGGNYYILINRENPEEKYQFHFESSQYMDVEDEPVDVFKVLEGDDASARYLSKQNSKMKKMLSYKKRLNGYPSDIISNFIDNIDNLKSYDITEEEALTYVLPGYMNNIFYVFKDGVTDECFGICLPEMDWDDCLSDCLYGIDKVVVLDGVTTLSEEQVENLHGLKNVDFGTTVEYFEGDISHLLKGPNIKLPKSLYDLGDNTLTTFKTFYSHIENVAIPSHLIEDGDLQSVFVCGSSRDGNKPAINIFTDDVEFIKEQNEELLNMYPDIKLYPYEDYDKFVKD